MDYDKANKWDADVADEFKNKIRKQREAASVGTDVAIIAGKFSGLQEWKKVRAKRSDGILIRAIKAAFKELEENEPAVADLKVLGGKGDTGLQLEHGQSGGIGGGVARVLTVEGVQAQQSSAGSYEQHQYDESGQSIGTKTQRMYNKGVSGFLRTRKQKKVDFEGEQKLKKAIETYKVNMDITLERDAYMKAEGLQFHAHYAPVVTITSAASNQENAQKEEKKFLKAFEDEIKALLELPGSSTIDEMARDGVLHNLNGNGKGRKTTGAGKPRKSQRTKTKGAAKGSFNRKEKINIIRDRGHGLSANQLLVAAKSGKNKGRSAPSPRRPRKSGSSNMPLQLLGILNKELPDIVRANMGTPRLTNITGRFASSVRAVDMVPTPQGFPSIGYTYQRDPYETFERDLNYDPRTLIDQSIREIAAQHAIGRFYTRRV
jgi:hypothetical protein